MRSAFRAARAAWGAAARRRAPAVLRTAAVCGAAAVVGVGYAAYASPAWLDAGQAPMPSKRPRKDWPVFSRAEVAKHKSAGDGIWVTFDGNVYDVTEFAANHPGGAAKLMLAAGGALEPYWKLYAVHNHKDVRELLAEFQIGRLPDAEIAALKAELKAKDPGDPYGKDPERLPALVVVNARPFNAETPLPLVAETMNTPQDIFFVRNHLPVPTVDPAKYRLVVEVEGAGPNGAAKRAEYTLEELRKFAPASVTTTIQCAGNRRSEMTAIKPVRGLNWTGGAISTATFSGVRLRDVLRHAGVREEDVGARIAHVQFEGLDVDPAGQQRYGGSILARKALDPRGDVILAFEMNGEPLSRDHGYPLRVVVPGVVGARNVKWLSRVVASAKESDNFWQQRDYKGFNSSVDWDTVNFDCSPAIQELPVTSAICEPSEGAKLEAGTPVNVRGYAYTGGGRRIVRVDVSADGGATWRTAALDPAGQEQEEGRAWAWTPWSASVELPAGATTLVCKAVDSSYNVQPESVGPIWNLRGVLSTAWHRVQVTAE